MTYTDVEASATTDFSGPTTVDIPTGVLFFSTMLTLVDDDIVEIDETFLVEVESIGSTASPTGTVSIILGTTQLTTTVTIQDDDTGKYLSLHRLEFPFVFFFKSFGSLSCLERSFRSKQIHNPPTDIHKDKTFTLDKLT